MIELDRGRQGQRQHAEPGGGGVVSPASRFFFFLVRGEEKKKASGDFSQVFVGLSQNVGTANQITSVS